MIRQRGCTFLKNGLPGIWIIKGFGGEVVTLKLKAMLQPLNYEPLPRKDQKLRINL
jgi:hypothetical protein